MVEIALAIAVIAIGLSSVLVLFPICINATRAAMDENTLPDVTEYVTFFVRSQFYKKWASDYTDTDFSFFGSSYPDSVDSSEFKETGEDGFPEIFAAKNVVGVYKYSRSTALSGGEDFSAEIKIWKPANDINKNQDGSNYDKNSLTCPLYVPNASNDFKLERLKSDTNGTIDLADVSLESFIQSVLVEISWGDNRKIFRVDVFNPYYRIEPTP
jgi:hypothetical protein